MNLHSYKVSENFFVLSYSNSLFDRKYSNIFNFFVFINMLSNRRGLIRNVYTKPTLLT